MSEWRPIETAPRDGTEILSWDGTQRVVVRWCGCEREWVVATFDQHGSLDTSPWLDVTMWQPLPDKPVKSPEPPDEAPAA